jgi:UDP-N-acetylmuramoyl-L-alanyl-D-glutamate--2,6-diaminopimelate ligase
VRTPVSLRRLFPQASFVGCADIRVTEATERSDECRPGMLFAALPGSSTHGAHFVPDAVARGANALLVSRPQPGASVPQCVVPNARRCYAELCAALAGWPARRLGLVGVTGTNGKTTVTWMVRSILRAAGLQAGLVGTIETDDGVETRPSEMTTPDARSLARTFSAMVDRGTTHAAMEVSSHALDQERTAGTLFDAAVVTNVTQDHFDYHGGFEAYLASKARIAGLVKPGGIVALGADDPGSGSLVDRIDGSRRLSTFGIERRAAVSATILSESLAGTRFLLRREGRTVEIRLRLPGRHNVANCLAAAAAVAAFDVPDEIVAAGIEGLERVPGRLERIDCGQPFDVFVDYAHTDDALRRVVRVLKSQTTGRTICVFGAGGDRDRTKRPLLGRAAAEADLAIVTSDNPRSEPPERILAEIVAGFPTEAAAPLVEPDRAEAIRRALAEAGPGDCVLIAGKGHETVQITGTVRVEFDDRAVARRFLRPDFVQTAEREPHETQSLRGEIAAVSAVGPPMRIGA